jgi:hypothetical protein
VSFAEEKDLISCLSLLLFLSRTKRYPPNLLARCFSSKHQESRIRIQDGPRCEKFGSGCVELIKGLIDWIERIIVQTIATVSNQRNAHKSSAGTTTTTHRHAPTTMMMPLGIIIVAAACRVAPELPPVVGMYYTNSFQREVFRNLAKTPSDRTVVAIPCGPSSGGGQNY